jgi:hypothetical protein
MLGHQHVQCGTDIKKNNNIGLHNNFLTFLLLGFRSISSEQVASMHSWGTKDYTGIKHLDIKRRENAESDGTKILSTD